MDFSHFDPPSGVCFLWTKDSLKITLQFNALIKLAILLFWILFTVFVAIIFFNPGAFRFRAGDINWAVLGPIWAVATLLTINFLLVKTVINATPQSLKVVHQPWHFPFTKTAITRNITGIDIETIVYKHSKRPVYRFDVQLNLANDYWKPVIFSSQDQDQSVFIREILIDYLDQEKASRI